MENTERFPSITPRNLEKLNSMVEWKSLLPVYLIVPTNRSDSRTLKSLTVPIASSPSYDSIYLKTHPANSSTLSHTSPALQRLLKLT